MSDGESETLNEISRYPESGRREALEPSRVGKIWQPDRVVILKKKKPDRVSILCKVTLRVTWGSDKRWYACPYRFRRCSNRSVYRLSTRERRSTMVSSVSVPTLPISTLIYNKHYVAETANLQSI